MNIQNMDQKTEMEGFINCKWRSKVFLFSKMRLLVNAVWLDLYLQKLPRSAITGDVFYCRFLEKYKADGPWYSQQPRGQNYLNGMV